MELNVIAIY